MSSQRRPLWFLRRFSTGCPNSGEATLYSYLHYTYPEGRFLQHEHGLSAGTRRSERRFRPVPRRSRCHLPAGGLLDRTNRWTPFSATAAEQWPDTAAIIDAERRYTFAELDSLADLVAARLHALGLRAGDRVLLQLPNSTQFAVAFFGLLRAGVVPVMCLSGHRSAELSHFAAVSGAVGLVITDTAAGFDFREMAAALQQEHPALRHVIVDGDPGPYLPWSTLTAPPSEREAAAPPARDELRCRRPGAAAGLRRHHRAAQADRRAPTTTTCTPRSPRPRPT